MVDCSDCKKKIVTDDQTGYATVMVTMSSTSLWPGKKWSLKLCERCLLKFEKKVGYEN